MPESLIAILDELEALARYEGPWQPLREAARGLHERLAELRARAGRLDDVLVIALIGGSGVGKSTLLNALAGDELAATSELRPCTPMPMVYHPPGVTPEFGGWKCISGSALERLVVIDTPDSDTIVRDHRAMVIETLAQTDLILVCGSEEKYLDEATFSLLRPLAGARTIICVETKARPNTSEIRKHWLARLEEQGISAAAYFRVSALHALDRKLAGAENWDDGFDFLRIEAFLRDELSKERIRRIKKSNIAGLLHKTTAALDQAMREKSEAVSEAGRAVSAAERALFRQVAALIEKRLFAEPHLWRFVSGREIAARAKGIVLTCFRVLEAIRELPARAAGWLPRLVRGGAGQRAAALLTDKDLFEDESLLSAEALGPLYENAHGAFAVALAQAGFVLPTRGNAAEFAQLVSARTAQVLREPAREQILRTARLLTSWPIALLADFPVLAFLFFFAYKTVRTFFSAALLSAAYFVHAAAVLAIIVLAELFVFSIAARVCAWLARKAAVSALRAALAGNIAAFPIERGAVAEATDILERVRVLTAASRGETT